MRFRLALTLAAFIGLAIVVLGSAHRCQTRRPFSTAEDVLSPQHSDQVIGDGKTNLTEAPIGSGYLGSTWPALLRAGVSLNSPGLVGLGLRETEHGLQVANLDVYPFSTCSIIDDGAKVDCVIFGLTQSDQADLKSIASDVKSRLAASFGRSPDCSGVVKLKLSARHEFDTWIFLDRRIDLVVSTSNDYPGGSIKLFDSLRSYEPPKQAVKFPCE